MTDPQPLTGDELATIKTRAEYALQWIAADDPRQIETLRLVAEIERLRGEVVRARHPVSLVGPIASPDYTMRAGWSHEPLPDRNTRATVVDCL